MVTHKKYTHENVEKFIFTRYKIDLPQRNGKIYSDMTVDINHF